MTSQKPIPVEKGGVRAVSDGTIKCPYCRISFKRNAYATAEQYLERHLANCPENPKKSE